MASSIQDGVESPFLTQKSTGMPPIGQYFHFFYSVWCKIIKKNQIWRNFPEWRPKWKKKLFCWQIMNFQRISKIIFAKIWFHLCSYIHAYFEFFKFKIAATNVLLDFCQKNRLLQKRVYPCQCTLFLKSVKAQMLSIYHLYTICFCFLNFYKMAI
jgi:hypothetical protein